jgi:hypothetical protein
LTATRGGVKHRDMKKLCWLLALSAPAVFADDLVLHTFKNIRLTDEFWCEGAYFGDFNHDGKTDVVSGPFWYEGPDFKTRHEIYPATASFEKKTGEKTEKIPGYEGARGEKNAYSDNFLTYVYDFNGDGWDDVLVYGFPGKEGFWYENPKGAAGPWPKHVALDSVDNESPEFGDVDGDGKPDIICMSGGFIGYATADWKNPTAKWTFHKISPKGPYQRFTHGIGFGDVNGDGKMDLLEKDGWWEQPASLAGDPEWKQHKFPFAAGCAQMFAYDVNGDGRNDVITCLLAHGYGLVWYEQNKDRDAAGEIAFTKHVIMEGKSGTNMPPPNKYGVRFSQLHALELVDMDGDGLKDIVTGKRFWAHGSHGDEDPNGAAVLYWFKLVRNADKSVDWLPFQIDNDSGVGTQVAVGDLNGDKLPDIVVGNKKGTFVHLQETKNASKDEWEKAQPKPVAATP